MCKMRNRLFTGGDLWRFTNTPKRFHGGPGDGPEARSLMRIIFSLRMHHNLIPHRTTTKITLCKPPRHDDEEMDYKSYADRAPAPRSGDVRTINLRLWNIKVVGGVENVSNPFLQPFEGNFWFYELPLLLLLRRFIHANYVSYWNALNLRTGRRPCGRVGGWIFHEAIRQRPKTFLNEWINSHWSDLTWHESSTACKESFLIYKKWICRKTILLCSAGKEQASKIINHFRLIEQHFFLSEFMWTCSRHFNTNRVDK